MPINRGFSAVLPYQGEGERPVKGVPEGYRRRTR